MSALDTFELHNRRSAHRHEATRLAAAASKSLADLQAAAGPLQASGPLAAKDYSEPTTLSRIVTDANEVAANITGWQRNIGNLEEQIAEAQSVARAWRIILGIVIVALVAGYFYFK